MNTSDYARRSAERLSKLDTIKRYADSIQKLKNLAEFCGNAAQRQHLKPKEIKTLDWKLAHCAEIMAKLNAVLYDLELSPEGSWFSVKPPAYIRAHGVAPKPTP